MLAADDAEDRVDRYGIRVYWQHVHRARVHDRTGRCCGSASKYPSPFHSLLSHPLRRSLSKLQLRGEDAAAARSEGGDAASCSSGSEESSSEDEEEESFGSMKRRIFAKKVTTTGPERERLAKEKDEALSRALRALKTTVSKVELANVKLEPADVKELCTGLAANKTIKELTISAAGLDGAASGRIAGALWESNSLERLLLPANSLGSAGCGMVFDAICNVMGLREIDLSKNVIGGDGRRSMFTSLASCKALEVLALDNNNLSCKDVLQLAEAISTVDSKLARLSVANNKIGDVGAAAIARSLPRALNLSSLDLTGNQIGDVGVCAFAEALSLVPHHLSFLSLSQNPFGADGAQALSAAPASLSLQATASPLEVHICLACLFRFLLCLHRPPSTFSVMPANH